MYLARWPARTRTYPAILRNVEERWRIPNFNRSKFCELLRASEANREDMRTPLKPTNRATHKNTTTTTTTTKEENMDLQLKEKLVIVTGSTGDGIGNAIAEELVRTGAYVIINGRSQGSVDKTVEAMLESTSADKAKVIGIPGDVASGEGADKFLKDVHAVEEKLGMPVYGLVNNVGIFSTQDFAEITDETWMQYYETNTMSGVRLSRHFLPLMLERNEGRILFISSECGLRPLPHMLAYSVSKTSQIALARGMAEMTKGTKVTVNSVIPGPTMTGGVRSYMEGFAKANNIPTLEEAVQRYFKDHEATSLLQRFLDPKEVAAVSVFTLSPLASGVNGACQHVDGGIVRHI